MCDNVYMNKKALEKALAFTDSWLRRQYSLNDIPGFTVAVAHKGKVIFSKAYGYADLESKKKLTPDSIFRVASHSKTFTATALMMLQEKGKLNIDNFVVDYLPWLKDHKDKRWSKVTLRQLMSHGAGVIRDGTSADYWQLEKPFPNEKQLQKEILASDLILENNVKLKYSNFGYSLLGLVIQSASDQPYNDYVASNIVNVLGLKNTGPEPTTTINVVTGYSLRGSNKTRLPISAVDTHAMSPATGFYSTASDMCLYFSAQMVGSNKLLNDESKKEMQRIHYQAYTPGDDSTRAYGLGLEMKVVGKRKVIGHSGGFPGFVTNSLFDTSDELVVSVMTNCLGGPATPIAKNIIHVIDYFQNNSPTVKPKHDLSSLEGIYLNMWGETDIIATGDSISAITPYGWLPLGEIENLERINNTTFKVNETNSFNSEGELVHFKMKDGKVESINYNGTTSWPEDVWEQRVSSKQSF